MAQVYNWQIGRAMEFPHEERHPSWQFAFVFNLNRCIGCQTCTMACKSTWTFSRGQEMMWWNNVETKPYGGYPQFWDVKTLKLLDEVHQKEGITPSWEPGAQASDSRRPYGTYHGLTPFEAALKTFPLEGAERVLGYLPSDEEWRFPNIYEDTPARKDGRSAEPTGSIENRARISGEGAVLPEHATWFFYLPRLCNHCEYPACLAACPRNAIYKRKEDGIVLIDQSRCRGYRKCVAACPYKRPMFRPTTRISEKCIACYPRVAGKSEPPGQPNHGVPLETRCMVACVGKIRLQGLVRLEEDGSWTKDPDHPLYYLIKEERVALPLYPQFGTLPNGYYIPPRWVPRGYLRQMFGPGVDEALTRSAAPSRELLAVFQLFRVTQQILFKFRVIKGEKLRETMIDGEPWSLYDDTVIGYNQEGKEVVRVRVEEPLYLRPSHHYNSI